MSERGLTPFQTVGPYFAVAFSQEGRAIAGPDLATPDAAGARIRIEGRVLDGAGAPVPDAAIEIWQADGEGRHATAPANAAFRGFGRAATDADGRYAFETVKPGPVPGPGGAAQAPHVAVSVFARGVLVRLATRIYFPDEPATATDPILALVPAERRGTLIAQAGPAPGTYRFDVRLRGEDETVFFDL